MCTVCTCAIKSCMRILKHIVKVRLDKDFFREKDTKDTKDFGSIFLFITFN